MQALNCSATHRIRHIWPRFSAGSRQLSGSEFQVAGKAITNVQPNEDKMQSATAISKTTTHRDRTVNNPLHSCFHIDNAESETISSALVEGETPLPVFFDGVFEARGDSLL